MTPVMTSNDKKKSVNICSETDLICLIYAFNYYYILVVVEERPPHMIVKRFGCMAIHNKSTI